MRYITLLLKIAIGGLLTFFLFERVPLGAVYEVYVQSSVTLLALAFVVILVGESLCVLRLQALLRLRNMRFRFIDLFQVYFMGSAIGNFMPSSIGSDIFKFFLLRPLQNDSAAPFPQGSSGRIASCFVVDRVVGLCALLVIFAAAAVIARHDLGPVWSSVSEELSLQSFLLIVGGFTFLFLLGLLLFRKFFLTVSRELMSFLRRPRDFVFPLLLAIGYQILLILAVFAIYKAVEDAPPIPFSSFFVFVPLINLATALPLSINGIGVREWLFVLLFSPLGASSSEMVAVSLMLLFFIILESAIGGLLFLGYDRRREIPSLKI